MDTELLSDTFIELADTMVADFDVIDFLHLLTDRSVALLAASAAGVVPANSRGELRLAAASSEEAGLLELFRLRNEGKLAPAGEQLPLPRRWGLTIRACPAPPAPQWPHAPSAARDWDFKGLTPGQDGQMSRLREHTDSSEEDGPDARGRRWRSSDAPLRAGGERAIGRTTVVSVVAMSCGLGLIGQTGSSPAGAVWGSLASSLITRLEGVPCQSGTKRVSWGLMRPDQSGRGGCP